MTKARTLADNFAADINQVNAGVGITGGGTSGTVTITNDMATTINAAGDLLYGTANDAYTRLGIGTAGQYLKVNSGATAPEWATLSAGGMTELASGSLSGTTITLSSISQGYKDLVLVLRDFSVSNNAAQLNVGLNNQASGQIYGYTVQQYVNSLSQTYTYISPWATRSIFASGADNSLIVRIFDYTSTTYHNINALGTMKETASEGINYGFWNGSTLFTTAIDRIDIFLNSVYEFDAGTYILYGVK